MVEFYRIDAGDITIGNHSIYNIKTSTIRKHMICVKQETELFTDTVKANLTFGSDRDIPEE